MTLNAARHPSMADAVDMPADTAQPLRRLVRGVVRGIGAIAVFGAFAAGMALMWEHAFGFSMGEAWALSVSLATTIGMLVVLMVSVVLVVKHEEDAQRS